MMVRKMLSIVVMAAVLYVTVPPAFAQQQNVPTPPKPPTGGSVAFPLPPAGISSGLMKTATATLVATQVAIQKQGYFTAPQIATVSTTLNDVFANVNDSGWTAALQAWILANPALFTTNPTTAELTAVYNMAHAAGSNITQAQVDSYILNIPLVDRQALYTQVKASGLAYVHAQFVAAVAALSNQARIQGGNMLIQVDCMQDQATSVPWLSIASEYVSIVAIASAVTAGGAVPVFAIIMAVAGLVALYTGC